MMYHYVRDLQNSRYPEIRGLTTHQFTEQIEYLRRHYQFITADDLLACADGHSELPPRAVLLTFDDGYIDHFVNVFPILKKRNISGCFFLPAKAILEHQVLDVNKSHFILASVQDRLEIMREIVLLLDQFRGEYKLKSNQEYFDELATENRYDPREIIFIKRFLQKARPEKIRKKIVKLLFEKYVTKDEGSFSKELYMDMDQIRHMQGHGMYIGSHGYDHRWLDLDAPELQEQEVKNSVKFLSALGCDVKSWIMCYPYGGYNDSLCSIINRHGCKVALTSRIEIADLNRDRPLLLPRLDTNDLPKDRNAMPNEWTIRASQQEQESFLRK